MAANWPWPRRYHAVVIDHLLAAGAKLIAFDVGFTQQTDAYDDNALIEAVDRDHNVVLATTAVAAGGQTGVLGGDTEQQKIGAHVGDATVRPDSQGVIRDMQHSYQGIDTFPWRSPRAPSGTRSARGSSAARSGACRSTIRGRQELSLRTPTGAYTPTPTTSSTALGPEGKIVIVGASAPSLQDVHPTPTSGSELMDGPRSRPTRRRPLSPESP